MIIKPNQHFKIRIEYFNGLCKDEFISYGQSEYDRLIDFAYRIIDGCNGIKLFGVVVKMKTCQCQVLDYKNCIELHIKRNYLDI